MVTDKLVAKSSRIKAGPKWMGMKGVWWSADREQWAADEICAWKTQLAKKWLSCTPTGLQCRDQNPTTEHQTQSAEWSVATILRFIALHILRGDHVCEVAIKRPFAQLCNSTTRHHDNVFIGEDESRWSQVFFPPCGSVIVPMTSWWSHIHFRCAVI